MARKYKDLLLKDDSQRTEEDYTSVVEEFVSKVGGSQLCTKLRVPAGIRNADYLIDLPSCDAVIELKQIRTNDFDRTFMSVLFRFMAHRGGISVGIAGTDLRIVGPGKEDHGRQLTFWDHVRPGVLADLKKAERQLKHTKKLLGDNRPVVCGLLMLNTGDENLPIDVLRQIVECRTAESWKIGQLRSLDFVIGGTLDMMWGDRHPQHSFLLEKKLESAVLHEAIQYIWTEWKSFLWNALGEEAQKAFSARDSCCSLDFWADFQGKLQVRKPGEPLPESAVLIFPD